MAPPVIIVTGASRGIGIAIARILLADPAQPNLVTVARSRDALEALRTESASHADRVAVLPGDFKDYTLGQKAVDLALQKWGRVDAVVLNHGILDPCARIADADPAAWEHTFQINVFSYVAMIKAAIPALRSSNGRIILTSSGAATNAYLGWGAYGSGKAALNHLALTLAKEEGEITSLAVRPGVVDTGMQEDIRTKYRDAMGADAEKFLQLHREGKLLKPEQPGGVIAKAALGAGKELSGKFLTWDSPELQQFRA